MEELLNEGVSKTVGNLAPLSNLIADFLVNYGYDSPSSWSVFTCFCYFLFACHIYKKDNGKDSPSTDGHNVHAQTTIETPIQPGTAQLRQPWKRLSVMAATLSLLPGRFPDVKMELWSSGCKLEAEIMKCWCQVCNPKWHPQSLFFKGQLAKPSTDIISDVYYKLDYLLNYIIYYVHLMNDIVKQTRI